MAPIYKEHLSTLLKVLGSSPQLHLLDFFMDNPDHATTQP